MSGTGLLTLLGLALGGGLSALGAVIVLAAYGVGLTYVHRRCRHG
jgi:hypothetical protein